MITSDTCWSIDQAAEHLGLGVDAARAQLSRMRVAGVRHYPALAVVTAHAARPGRGRRVTTDAISHQGTD